MPYRVTLPQIWISMPQIEMTNPKILTETWIVPTQSSATNSRRQLVPSCNCYEVIMDEGKRMHWQLDRQRCQQRTRSTEARQLEQESDMEMNEGVAATLYNCRKACRLLNFYFLYVSCMPGSACCI